MKNCNQITKSGILAYKKKIQDFKIEKEVRQIVTPWDFTRGVKAKNM